MSLEVAVQRRLGAFTLDAAFRTEGGVTALFGRSGAGKSTLANLVAGLTRPDEGRIVLDGVVLVDTARHIFLPRWKRRIGVVFQEGRLFPHLSVSQNLMFGRRFAAKSDRVVEPSEVVGLLGLRPLLDRRPRDLSGGERQRVAIGRALLMGPRALIMDEPFASLDEARKNEILPFVELLRDRMSLPILYVSHAVLEVARLAATVIVLDEGKVIRSGPPASVFGTADAGLLTEEVGGIVTAKVIGDEPEEGITRLAFSGGALMVPHFAAPAGTAVRVRIAARDIILARERPRAISAQNILAGTVAGLRALEGTTVEVLIDVGGERLTALVTHPSVRQLGLEPDASVFAIIKTAAIIPAAIGRTYASSSEEAGAGER